MHAERERGFATIQYVTAVGLSLLLLVVVANVLVDLYLRAAIRDALDEGAHAAIAVDASPAACAAQAREVLQGLAPGTDHARVEFRCAATASWVVARADASLPSWLPWLVPDWRITLRAVVAREG